METTQFRIDRLERIGKKTLKKVKDFKSYYKPNRYTYHNIDNDSAERLHKMCKYLNEYQDAKIYSTAVIEIQRWIDRQNELDFVRRFKIAEILEQNIIH